MSSGYNLGKFNIEGEYPSDLPHIILEEQEQVSVNQVYMDHFGDVSNREDYGEMSGSEASEWLQNFDMQEMLSKRRVHKGRMIDPNFTGDLEKYTAEQNENGGHLVIRETDRAPWPFLQYEEVEFSWEQ